MIGKRVNTALTSFLMNHFGFWLGFEKTASKTARLSLFSLTVRSTSGFMKLSCFYRLAINKGEKTWKSLEGHRDDAIDEQNMFHVT